MSQSDGAKGHPIPRPPRYILQIPTVQKQISCFNHRVVTLVADKLRRQWLCNVNFANCIRQPERKFPRPVYILNLEI